MYRCILGIRNYTFGFANQYFCKSNTFHHVWQDMNTLENPTVVSNGHEYYHAPCMRPDMA